MNISGYLGITPCGFKSFFVLSTTYLRAFFSKLVAISPVQFMGYFLRTDICIKVLGYNVVARSRKEDLSFYAHTSKHFTYKWFTPSIGENVIDCGASVGYFSLLASRNGCSVIAVEPNPETYGIFKRNISSNGIRNIQLINVALGNNEGKTALFVPTNSIGSASIHQKWVNPYLNEMVTRFNVEVTTIDRIAANLQIINWLLIDVEGSEYELLRGGSETLKRVRNIIIEVSHTNTEKVPKLLLESGFRPVISGSKTATSEYWLFSRA